MHRVVHGGTRIYAGTRAGTDLTGSTRADLAEGRNGQRAGADDESSKHALVHRDELQQVDAASTLVARLAPDCYLNHLGWASAGGQLVASRTAAHLA
jgi:hypothetical protein